MDIHRDRAAGRIVVRRPRHWIGRAFVAAGVLTAPATVWASGIAKTIDDLVARLLDGS